MRKTVCVLVLLGLALSMNQALALSQYHYTWSCSYTSCSFSANGVSGVSSYSWNFGDGTFGSGQSVNHNYVPTGGAGFYSPRVTLTYALSDGTFVNVRCFIQYYFSGGVGGDPTPGEYGGTCEGFN